MNLLTALRLWILANLGGAAVFTFLLYLQSALRNDPYQVVYFDHYGEWTLELVMMLSLAILVPLWIYLDRERIVTFLIGEKVSA